MYLHNVNIKHEYNNTPLKSYSYVRKTANGVANVTAFTAPNAQSTIPT
jgi:hypothetical protein